MLNILIKFKYTDSVLIYILTPLSISSPALLIISHTVPLKLHVLIIKRGITLKKGNINLL